MWTLISPTWIKTLWPLPVAAAHIVGSYWMLSLFLSSNFSTHILLKKKKKNSTVLGFNRALMVDYLCSESLIGKHTWECVSFWICAKALRSTTKPDGAIRKTGRKELCHKTAKWLSLGRALNGKGFNVHLKAISLGVSVISGMTSSGYHLRNKSYLFVYFSCKGKKTVLWHPEYSAAPACIRWWLFESASASRNRNLWFKQGLMSCCSFGER